MTEPRKLRVFLCHASQDKPVVRELYRRLLAEEWIDPWLDTEKLLPGQDWDLEIEKAVEDADAVIVCLSNHSVTKEGYVQKELRSVLDVAEYKPEGAIFIIPLRLSNVQPPRRLRAWQYVDYFPALQRTRSYELLLQALGRKEEKQKSPVGIQMLPIVSGLCGGALGLVSYFLSWVAPSPSAVYKIACTGFDISQSQMSRCYWFGSPLLYLVPLFFLTTILQVFLSSRLGDGKIGSRFIDFSVYGTIIFLSHFWYSISVIFPVLPGFTGTLLAFALIFFGGIHQSSYELQSNKTLLKSFWSQKLRISFVLIVFFGFALFAVSTFR